VRHKKPENFLRAIAEQGHGTSEERALPPLEQAAEALLMGLRLAEGVDLLNFETRFGFGNLVDEKAVAQLCDFGMVWRNGARLGVTAQGRPLLDALLTEIVADELVEA
jgi:oxygen-independent coproporphyrinogen-3 oxidase